MLAFVYFNNMNSMQAFCLFNKKEVLHEGYCLLKKMDSSQAFVYFNNMYSMLAFVYFNNMNSIQAFCLFKKKKYSMKHIVYLKKWTHPRHLCM
jgi:hypothetical protein